MPRFEFRDAATQAESRAQSDKQQRNPRHKKLQSRIAPAKFPAAADSRAKVWSVQSEAGSGTAGRILPRHSPKPTRNPFPCANPAGELRSNRKRCQQLKFQREERCKRDSPVIMTSSPSRRNLRVSPSPTCVMRDSSKHSHQKQPEAIMDCNSKSEFVYIRCEHAREERTDLDFLCALFGHFEEAAE